MLLHQYFSKATLSQKGIAHKTQALPHPCNDHLGTICTCSQSPSIQHRTRMTKVTCCRQEMLCQLDMLHTRSWTDTDHWHNLDRLGPEEAEAGLTQ